MLSEAGVKDITWFTPAGEENKAEDWNNPLAMSLGYVLSGAAGEFFTPGGRRDIDESFLVIMNADSSDIDFHIPLLAAPMAWETLVDTSRPSGLVEDGRTYAPGEVYPMRASSFALFINRAPRPELRPAMPNALGTAQSNREEGMPDRREEGGGFYFNSPQGQAVDDGETPL